MRVGPDVRQRGADAAVTVPDGGFLVSADERPAGVSGADAVAAFRFEQPRLVRLTRGRYLRAEVFRSQRIAASSYR